MSREQILEKIRLALGAPHSAAHSDAASAYRRQGDLSATARRDLMVERLREYDARVFLSSASAVALMIGKALHDGEKRRMLAPAGLPPAWLTDGVEWIDDQRLSYAAIEGADGVLTSATAAVAESGSLVLTHGPGQGRRALTLLPDYHLCVLYAAQIVETLPECFARLAGAATQPLTFISGPSATADIEMTRIKGVHGPRFLDVVLVVEDDADPQAG